MKDYLKNYIDTLSEDRLDGTKIPPIDIGVSKQSIENRRIQEANVLAKNNKADQEPSPPSQIAKSKEEGEIKENKQRRFIKDNPEWDIYKERVFVKTLLHQRFNYFIIIYAITILSATIVDVKVLQSIILVTGLFILAMLWFNLVSVYIEFEEIFKLFHKAVSRHNILDVIEQKISERQSFLSQLPMNSVLAYGVPVLSLVSILCYLSVILIVL